MHVERLLSLSNLILVINMIYQPLLCFSITTQLTYPLTDGRVTITQSRYNKMSLFLIMTNLRMKLILYVKNDYSSILVFLPKFFLYTVLIMIRIKLAKKTPLFEKNLMKNLMKTGQYHERNARLVSATFVKHMQVVFFINSSSTFQVPLKVVSLFIRTTAT